jgi:hypothetical protein
MQLKKQMMEVDPHSNTRDRGEKAAAGLQHSDLLRLGFSSCTFACCVCVCVCVCGQMCAVMDYVDRCVLPLCFHQSTRFMLPANTVSGSLLLEMLERNVAVSAVVGLLCEVK